MLVELQDKNADIESMVGKALKNKDTLKELLEGLKVKNETYRYNCHKVLYAISEKRGETLYPYWNLFVESLGSENSYHKMTAVHLIANLTSVDKENRFEKIFDKYYSLLDDKSMVVAYYVANVSGKIIKNKPALKKDITDKLLSANNTRLLVDCGLFQEREFQRRNWEPFRVAAKKLGAVLLTHAHLDHCGLLPKLVNEGFRGRIICTAATAEIAAIILLDSARLQEEDAAYKKKRHIREGRKVPYPEIPLYTVADVEATLPLFAPVAYNTPVSLGDGIEATFHDAGHVLGSAMIRLLISQGGEKRSIIFSGDIGRWDRPMLQDPSVFRKTDYVVVESTYGDRAHEGTEDIGDELAEIVNSTSKAGGNIIVPSFALQRTQEILYYLNLLRLENRIPALAIYLDSPMAVKITRVFQQFTGLFDREMKDLLRQHNSPFDFPGFKMVETVAESKALNEIKGTVMIIAGSGMCTGGRIKHHLTANISRPESTVLFVGYQAAGTLGRQILDGAASVRIHGQPYPVRARIARIQGFSAHADRDDLLRWFSRLSVSPRHVYITHGESNAAEKFREFLTENTGFEASVPAYGAKVRLE